MGFGIFEQVNREKNFMKKIKILTPNLKKKILELLYFDEMYNVILIGLIEKQPINVGELYINEKGREVTEILHIKNDGNSNFSNFLFKSVEGIKSIAFQIKQLNYNKILLAGKVENVHSLLKALGLNRSISPNNFYKLDIDRYKNLDIKFDCQIRLARLNDQDIERYKQFIVNFFEAETEEDIKNVTNIERIIPTIEAGVYFLEYQNKPIGMARFIGKTKKFSEITSVYIERAYRKKGFGKELIGHMIKIAIQEEKIPVLVTSVANFAAVKTYEAMGFEKQENYAFEFLD